MSGNHTPYFFGKQKQKRNTKRNTVPGNVGLPPPLTSLIICGVFFFLYIWQHVDESRELAVISELFQFHFNEFVNREATL